MHHANLLVGSREWGYASIPEEDRTPGPDTLLYEREQLAIDEVRTITYEASLKPGARDRRTFIIATEALLPPAQNALLKLLEEPNPDTVFYLIIPREDILLPTLRSRLNLAGVETMKTSGSAFEAFRKAPYATRLGIVQERLTAEDDAWVEALRVGFEEYARSTKSPELIREAVEISERFYAPGSSKKMLLEHIALSL